MLLKTRYMSPGPLAANNLALHAGTDLCIRCELERPVADGNGKGFEVGTLCVYLEKGRVSLILLYRTHIK